MLEYLTDDDKSIVSQISGVDFGDLWSEVIKLPVSDIFNTEKCLSGHPLNRSGLQLLRVLLAQRMTQARRERYNLQNSEYANNGVIVRHGFSYTALRNNQELIYMMGVILGQKNPKIKSLSRKEVVFENKDVQYDLHVDSFHSIVKVWVYQHKVKESAFNYVLGSHKNTKDKLRWLFSCSLLEEPCTKSFRLKQTGITLEGMGLPKQTAITGDRNTLVVADTSGLHCRGFAPGQTRTSIRLNIVRQNPFIGV